MENGQPVPGSLYVCAPDKEAPAFFAVAFAISAAGHIWQCHRYKTWKLVGLHPFCAVVFTLGYATREYESFNYIYNDQNFIIYILSQIFIYICPPLLELAIYHVLGRIFYYVPHFAPLAPSRILSTFGALMALVEVINALGVAFSQNPSSTPSKHQLIKHLTIAALAIQLGVVAIFALLAITFYRRCANANIRAKTFTAPLITLYVSMSFILIRCIYCLVEFLGNTTVDLGNFDFLKYLSPILRYEWFFYVFEATLMLANSLLWNIWNPGRYLPRDHHVYLARDGTEVRGQDLPDDRSILAKLGHVVTFGIFFHRKKEINPGEAQR
ncbi:putative RTA1 domain protein [Tothia fuscella]|uniref:RTA1 domain protein n=1 Tax=Tothia fuscella TaxID=1048955 RepID=A0A9P4NYC1_9PEZI|nr:putative RTA1 domain protein [Tothia fuscella]